MTLHTNRTPTALNRIALLIAFSVSTASAVSAQTPPAPERSLETPLTQATAVRPIDSVGPEENSGMTRLQERRSDSLLNGALIGAGVAVASGLFLCRATEPWDVCLSGDNAGPLVGFAAIGAGIGIGIDALIRGQKTHETPVGRLHATPLVGRRGAGLRMSFSF